MLGIARLGEAYEKAVPGYDRRRHRAGHRGRPQRRGGHQRLPPDHAGLRRPSGRPTSGRAPLTSTREVPGRDRRGGAGVYKDVNNGVYQAGFATSQRAYEAAYGRLFKRLDWLSDRLAGQRFLVGDTITEADVRLFTTLARFDAVYHGHFKCNRSEAERDAGAVGLRA